MSEILPDHPQSRLHRLFDRNFLDYSAYVIREQAIPDIDDGLKPLTTLVRAGITALMQL
ncbi:hypothetical protein [Candidatus Electronema sp. JM]|uniref:hypothetical protein n=1 Tax=Candidatus Electronema sp. JM TaxID=3401571 RepID=UPI003AA99DC1